MNIKYIISYSGLIPFFYLIIDGYFLGYLNLIFINDLAIFMSCIIFTFIGAYNWDFRKDNIYLEIYGFLPSLFSMIVLFLNLIDSSTPFFSNDSLSLSVACRIDDVFKTSFEFSIFFKIFDQTETTSSLILSKLLKDPKVKYLFFINGGELCFLSKSNPQCTFQILGKYITFSL